MMLNNVETQNSFLGNWLQLRPGSSYETTMELRCWLPLFARAVAAHTLLDFGCGARGWMESCDIRPTRYIGVDIDAETIAYNQEQCPETEFHVIGRNPTDLPQADIVFCKDVFQHLSNSDVLGLIETICSTRARFLITSADSYPPPPTNESRDFESVGVCDGAGYVPENLKIEPFHLTHLIGTVILDHKFYQVWDLDEEPISHRILYSVTPYDKVLLNDYKVCAANIGIVNV